MKIQNSSMASQFPTYIFLLFFCFLSFQLSACATSKMKMEKESEMMNRGSKIEEQWGIEIKGIRLSAAGYMLDFRYRIIDPQKAVPITDSKIKPYLIDEATGAKLIVPTPPKVGALRTTARNGNPLMDRTYFIIFANPGRFVKTGSKVTLVVGDFRVEHLAVI